MMRLVLFSAFCTFSSMSSDPDPNGLGDTLEPNKIVVSDINQGETKHFSVETEEHDTDLIIALTDLGAYAEMSGGSWAVVEPGEGNGKYQKNSEFSFAVSSEMPGEFSLAVSFNRTIYLKDGTPQRVVLNPEEKAYLRASMDPNPAEVDFSVIPISGIPLIHVGTDEWPDMNDESTYHWTLGGASTQSGQLIVMKDDPKWPGSPMFLMSICNVGEGTTIASVTATSSHESTVLIPGIPVEDRVEGDKYKYYRVVVSGGTCDLLTIVTTIDGDPDLYMSQIHNRPTKNNHEEGDTSAERWGSDLLQYTNATGTYYAGVLGANNTPARYTIIAILRCPEDKHSHETYTNLINGNSQVDMVGANEPSFYHFEVPEEKQDVTVSIIPMNGDPDVRVRKWRADRAEGDDDWIWTSTSWGADFLKIPANDPNLCQSCVLEIKIDAWQPSVYTITASTATAILELRNGVSTTAQVNAGQYAYFSVDVDRENENVDVFVTPRSLVDVYVYGSKTYHYPNATNFEFQCEDHAQPDLKLAGIEGTYYVAVTSNSLCTFDIVATVGGIVGLTDGVVQNSDVENNQRKHFEMLLNVEGHLNVEITMQINTGDANLYVSTSEIPDPDDWGTFQFWDMGFGTSIKRIEINHDDPNHCLYKTELDTICHLFVTVVGVQNHTEFTMIAATNQAIIPLFSGQPYRSSVSSNHYEYFQISPTAEHQKLDLQITSFRGDANAYISTKTQHPNVTNNEWTLTEDGDDSFHVDHTCFPCTYFIGVTTCERGLLGCGYTGNTTFSIVGTVGPDDQDGYTLLLDGVPQRGNMMGVNHWNKRLYEVRVLEGTTQLEISVVYTLFPPKVYVNTEVGVTPGKDHYQWKHKEAKDALITIQAPKARRYFIGVWCKWMTRFTITASTSDKSIELQDGVPFPASLLLNSYLYFDFPVEEKKDLSIALTSMSGDADLYVAVGWKPTTNNSTWMSVMYGSDAVYIHKDDPNACGNCVYTIGAYAFTESEFSITASYEEPSVLSDGTPVFGSMTQSAWRYYVGNVQNDKDTTLTISAAITLGDLEMYVSKGPKIPTMWDFDWTSNHWGSAGEAVVIHHEKTGDEEVAYYNIALYADTDCHYSLVLNTEGSMQMLQNNVPAHKEIEGGVEAQFSFTLRESVQSLAFSMTPITGNPVMYARFGEIATSTDHDWDVVEGAGSIQLTENIEQGSYYLSVFAGISGTSFTIAASATTQYANDTGTMLVNGQSQYGTVLEGQFAVYSWVAGPAKGDTAMQATISLNALSGDPDLYVRKDTRPTLQDYDFRVINHGGDTLTIPEAVPAEHTNKWFVSVYGSEQSDYYLTVTVDQTIMLLQQGVPITADIKANDVAYFRFFVESVSKDVDIHITSFLGEPSVYVSDVFQYPNATSARYTGNHDALGISIRIPQSELSDRTTWFIAVAAGPSNAYVNVLASYSEIIMVQEGIPQSATLSMGLTQVFKWHVGQGAEGEDKSLTFALSPILGTVVLMVGVDREPIIEDPSTYHWSTRMADLPGLEKRDIVVREDDPFFKRPADYYALAECGTSDEVCEFYFTATTSHAIDQLQLGAPTSDSVMRDMYKYYSVLVGEDSKRLDLTITKTVGNVYIYLSSKTQRPKDSEHEWESKTGSLSLPNPLAGTYFLGIRGVETGENGYTLVALVEKVGSLTPTILVAGARQSAVISENESAPVLRLYSLKVNRRKALWFRIEVLQGTLDVHWTDNGEKPSEDSKGSQDFYGQEKDLQITIPKICEECSYLILIKAEPGTVYAISAHLSHPHRHSGESKEEELAKDKSLIKFLVAAVVGVIVFGCGILAVFYFKKRRLEFELDVAELELNMAGRKSRRQREDEENEDVKVGPPMPPSEFSVIPNSEEAAEKSADIDTSLLNR